MGQEPYSCDTTQLDACASARFTRHHACPVDNGWVPVGIYLVARSSRPRKSIRPAAPRPVSTIGGSLQVCRAGYSSFSQVCCCLVVGVIIAAGRGLCQPPIFSPGEREGTGRAEGGGHYRSSQGRAGRTHRCAPTWRRGLHCSFSARGPRRTPPPKSLPLTREVAGRRPDGGRDRAAKGRLYGDTGPSTPVGADLRVRPTPSGRTHRCAPTT